MKKAHHKSLKYHTIYNLTLSAIFLGVIILDRSAVLITTLVFLILYITGNGIIHTKFNKFSREALIEYIVVSIIALIILVDAIVL